MPISSLAIKGQEKPLKNLIVQFIAILSASCGLAKFTAPTLWTNYHALCHTLMDMMCIFICLASFFTVWHTYHRNPPVNQLLGFGFLMVAIFDIMHTCCFYGLGLYTPEGHDLSTIYLFLGRLTEAAVLLLCSSMVFRFRVKKWIGLIISVAVAVGISLAVIRLPDKMPSLFTPDEGLIPARIGLEYVIIAMFTISLYYLMDLINSRDILTYRYIFLALLIAIPTGLCFTMFIKTLSPFYNVMGHLLRLIYHYYLFRGVFVSAVTYPYEKLEEAGKHMNSILNGMPIGMIMYDNNFRLSFINEKAKNILELKEKEAIGLTAEEVCRRIFGSQFNGEPLVKQVSRNPDNVKSRLITIRNNQNNELKVNIEARKLDTSGSILTITDAKVEQQLEYLQLQTNTVLNSISNLVLLANRKHKIIMCNRSFEETVEMATGHIIGMNLSDLYKQLHFEKKEVFPQSPPGNQSSRVFEVSFISAGGNRKELLLHQAEIYNVDGEIIGLILVASDITTLKKEQREAQQREKLMLLGEMAAGVVHEIKNPLTAIKGFSHLIAAKTEDTMVRDYARIIENTANEVNKVVSDFLAFAKPRRPVLKPLLLNDLLQSIAAILEEQLLLKGVVFKFIPSSQEKTVMADESQIKQVVLNMVQNAVEATSHQKNPRLTVSTRLNASGDEMILTVSDNGSGMSPEDKLKAGTPFFTTKDKGTGLGLCICYQIVNGHGGRIVAESEPGRGTDFVISLPCKTPAGRHAKNNQSSHAGIRAVSEDIAL